MKLPDLILVVEVLEVLAVAVLVLASFLVEPLLLLVRDLPIRVAVVEVVLVTPDQTILQVRLVEMALSLLATLVVLQAQVARLQQV